ncbi:MAG: DNA ligase [Polaromonas sp.]
MSAHVPPAHVSLTAGIFRIRTLPLLLTVAGLLTPALPLSAAEASPPLMLAKVYQAGVSLPDYWISEKFDGVRGYWDGERLLTRGGERIAAPDWFTAGWPKVPLDGELWAGRGQFARAVSIVRQQTADDEAWHTMRFMVFDLPAGGGPFTERLQTLNSLLAALSLPWVQVVAQSKVAGPAALLELLRKTVKIGGEGLMLHRGASLYKAQRTDDLLKFKTHEDSEARVVAHIPGKGKYAGQLGALVVEMPAVEGEPVRRFKLGTGFTDAQRQDPPAIGTRVTYRFRGLNDSGIPRFASFMRLRED